MSTALEEPAADDVEKGEAEKNAEASEKPASDVEKGGGKEDAGAVVEEVGAAEVEVEEKMEAAEVQQPLESSRLPPGVIAADEVREIDTRPCIFRHITLLVKIWAVLALAGMWVCTVFAIERREEKDFSPWYCLGSSVIVTFFELFWYINKCAICKDKGGCCCTCWRVLMWVDNWKKGVFYIVVAIPNFINLVVLVLIAGVLLVVLGLFYIVKSFVSCRCCGGKKYVKKR